MLVDEPAALQVDDVLAIIARVGNRTVGSRRIAKGVYEVGHFGSSWFLEGRYEHYPEELTINAYGVCDNAEQLLLACPELTLDRIVSASSS